MNHSGHVGGAAAQTAGYARDIPPAPMNPLPGAIERAGLALNDLGVTADTVAARLGRLCTSPMPCATGEQSKGLSAVCANSDMVQDVNRMRERIENITAGLQDVLNRLEA